jgi:hypothetical protein
LPLKSRETTAINLTPKFIFFCLCMCIYLCACARCFFSPDTAKLASYAPNSEEQQAAVVAIQDEDGFNWGYINQAS